MDATSHEYQGYDDLQMMIDIVAATLRETSPKSLYHVGDIVWGLTAILPADNGPNDPNHDIRIWIDNFGEAIGFAWYYSLDAAADWLICPKYRNIGVESAMLNWLEQRYLMQPEGRDSGQRFILGCCDDEPEVHALLTRRGYSQSRPAYIHLMRSLEGSWDVPTLEGFVFRNITGEDEVEELALVHRKAFESSMTSERYLKAMRSEYYRKELDLIAETEGGAFAAFVLCWLDKDSHIAEFEPVGCAPGFRRRGLVRSLIFEGLRRMKEQGAETAVVHVDAANLPAIRLFESCGFSVLFSEIDYTNENL